MTTSKNLCLRCAALLPVAFLVLAAGCKDQNMFPDSTSPTPPLTTEPSTQNAPMAPMAPADAIPPPQMPEAAPPAPGGMSGQEPAK